MVLLRILTQDAFVKAQQLCSCPHRGLQKFPGGAGVKDRVVFTEVSAQDLLGKSHEELVLMLIHLRRQAANLNEAIDTTRSGETNDVMHCRSRKKKTHMEQNRQFYCVYSITTYVLVQQHQ